MTLKEFIEKAIHGGWNPPKRAREIENMMLEGNEYLLHSSLCNMFLDPKAWQAVGKIEGWSTESIYKIQYEIDKKCARDEESIKKNFEEMASRFSDKKNFSSIDNMHRMIDSLAEGKTFEQALELL